MHLGISLGSVSIAIAISGILILFFLQGIFEAKEMKIGEITREKTGLAVVAKGRVNWFSEKEKTISFELYDGNKILGVKFNPSIEERQLFREQKFLKITGKIQLYNRQLEIVVEKAEEWNQ
ncbi:MAG TPA: OB-fold nucleic acid binding domain-containing protein [archaeon]|nr:OB-fold nucleic acid binding domain-containing protein [archaeon]